MKLIELPSLKWFNFGNIFTGSIGAEPGKGCLNSTTFNYKVKITDKNKLTAFFGLHCIGMQVQI